LFSSIIDFDNANYIYELVVLFVIKVLFNIYVSFIITYLFYAIGVVSFFVSFFAYGAGFISTGYVLFTVVGEIAGETAGVTFSDTVLEAVGETGWITGEFYCVLFY